MEDHGKASTRAPPSHTHTHTRARARAQDIAHGRLSMEEYLEELQDSGLEVCLSASSSLSLALESMEMISLESMEMICKTN